MKIHINLILIIMFLSGCNANKRSVMIETEWAVDTVYYLQENLAFLGEISSVSFTNDEKLVLSTRIDPSVLLYDISGKQLLNIKRQGRAEYEYINPAIVRTDPEGNIYIWCNMRLRLIVLDKNGTPLDEIPFPYAIRNFLPYRDYICFYRSGNEDAIIEIYDRHTRDVVFSAGKNPSQEHIFLSVNEISGGMALLGDRLLFSYADQLSINVIDLDNLEEKTSPIIINDEDFKVTQINGKARDLINGGRSTIMRYLPENSFVNGLYVTNNKILLKATTGRYNFNEDLTISNDSRKDKIYVFDHEFTYLHTVVLSYDTINRDKRYASDGKNLFYVEYIPGDSDNDNNYALNRLKID